MLLPHGHAWFPSLALVAFAASTITVTAATAPTADAGPCRGNKCSDKELRARADRTKRLLTSKRKRKRVPNMPRNWTWPPSRAMRSSGTACLRELTRRGIKYRRSKRQPKITTPVVVPSLRFGAIALQPTWRKPPFVMDCHLALALAREADGLAALGVRTLRFSTIYDVRRAKRDGRKKRVLSRHAVGLAVDVYELVDSAGRTIVVERDYRRGNRLLRAVEQHIIKSPAFRAIITPRSDPKSHSDHFHFEARMKIAR